ncbi:MAG: PIG-L deacetylase family protein [Promethearchaeota archaeon]
MPYLLVAPFPRGTRVLIVAAHPDDVEASFPNTVKQMVDWGCEVTEAYSTGGEYGANDPSFFGERLRRIRRREMEVTLDAYGTDEGGKAKIGLEWLGEIDGHVRVDGATLGKFKALFERARPEVVFLADPFLSLDWHQDHINTAVLTRKCVLEAPAGSRPKAAFCYFTTKADCFIPYERRDDQFGMMMLHRSQTDWRKHGWFHFFVRAVHCHNLRKVGRLAEGFRLLRKQPPRVAEQPFRVRVKDALTRKVMRPLPPERYFPPPEDLGLV